MSDIVELIPTKYNSDLFIFRILNGKNILNCYDYGKKDGFTLEEIPEIIKKAQSQGVSITIFEFETPQEKFQYIADNL